MAEGRKEEKEGKREKGRRKGGNELELLERAKELESQGKDEVSGKVASVDTALR